MEVIRIENLNIYENQFSNENCLNNKFTNIKEAVNNNVDKQVQQYVNIETNKIEI